MIDERRDEGRDEVIDSIMKGVMESMEGRRDGGRGTGGHTHAHTLTCKAHIYSIPPHLRVSSNVSVVVQVAYVCPE